MSDNGSYRALQQTDAEIDSRPSSPQPSRLEDPTGDVVQFSTYIYYVDEDEGYGIGDLSVASVSIDVMRIGSLEKEVSVVYETGDASAIEGEAYEAASGLLKFSAGESNKEITINLIPNNKWRPTLEFRVKLLSPEGCQLGQYLRVCRVKIIDNSVFPSDKFADTLNCKDDDLKKEVAGISHHFLFVEYWKLMFSSAGVKGSTLVVMLMSQMNNIYHVLLVYTSVYMVNKVLTKNATTEKELFLPNRTLELYLIGAVYVVPLLVLHCWDYAKVKIGLEGRITTFLRTSLFRKYLNYAPESRDKVDPGMISLALHSDVESLASGYMNVLGLFQVAGKLGLSLFFTFQKARSALWIVLLLPIFTVLWTICRERQVLKIKGATAHMAKLLNLIQDVTLKFSIFDSYGKRPSAVDSLEDKALDVQRSKSPKALFDVNSEYFLTWLGAILVLVWICREGPRVLAGESSLGAFLAVIKMLQDLRGDCLKAFTEYMQVVGKIKPLQRVTMLFNRDTDLLIRKEANRDRRGRSRAETDMSRKSQITLSSGNGATGGTCADDLVSIKLEGASFRNKDGLPVLGNCRLSLDQGTIVALTGAHRSGKLTLMKLLCMKSFPSDGSVFVPGHLRVLMVSRQPVMLRKTPYENLVFGLPAGRKPDHERIRDILTTLGMIETLALAKEDLDKPPVEDIDELDAPEAEDFTWIDDLSHTEYCLFHLARALISNPEVLLLEKPFHNYGEDLDDMVMAALRNHVKNRGLCMPQLDEKSSLDRRPRTLVFTAMNLTPKQAKIADVVWELTQCNGAGTQIKVCNPDGTAWG